MRKAGADALAPSTLMSMADANHLPPDNSIFTTTYQHWQRAEAAYKESRRNGEYHTLFFQEPDPADFLGEQEDGSLLYRTRSHDEAHVVLEMGLAGVSGLMGRWTRGKVTRQEGREEAAKWRDQLAQAEADLWADHDPQKWPQIALTLRELGLAYESLAYESLVYEGLANL